MKNYGRISDNRDVTTKEFIENRYYISGTEKEAPNGVATLDENAKIPTSQLPIIPVTGGGREILQETLLALPN